MTNRTATISAIILSLAAAGAPTATARPDFAPGANQPPPTVYSRPDKAMIPVSAPIGRDIAKATAPQAVVRVQIPQSGFDWGDAGIGAAGGLALAMLGLGGTLLVSQRPRHTRRTTAQPN